MTLVQSILERSFSDIVRDWVRVRGRRTEPPPNVDSQVEDLWPLRRPELSVANLRNWSERTLRSALSGDELLDNLILNKWEFAHGKTVLKSYPWRLSVPFILCNAKCDFCAAWLVKGNAPLDELMTALVPVIRRCWELDLVGWGEPLIHPQFAQILDLLRREADPRARLALTTNGTHLESWIDRLLASNVMAYAISMHAAKPETHQDLMGFKPGAFENVKRAVRMLTARKAEFPQLFVELVLVVTRQNIAEVPSFIAMSEDLGADQVHLRTLMPMESPRDGLDYHRLPPYLHPEFSSLHAAALAAISKTRMQVKADPATWARPVFSPEWERRLKDIPLTPRNERSEHYLKMKEIDWNVLGSGGKSCSREVPALADNLYDRSAPLYCPSPYTAFYVNGTDRRVIPCVYMHEVPDHDLIHFKPSMTFEEVWNSPAMVAVRHSLHHGPLMPTCLKCPFYC